MYILKHTSHILPRSHQPCVKPTTEDADFPLALGKGSPGAGRFEGPAQPGWQWLWGQQCGGVASTGRAGRAGTQGRGAGGTSDAEMGFWMLAHTPRLPPQAGALSMWCHCSGSREQCLDPEGGVPNPLRNIFGSRVDPTISTEKDATPGSPEHCTLPFPLQRLDPKAPRTWLQEVQVTPGLSGCFCGELRSPLVFSNVTAKSLVCFWASQDGKRATFSKQLSKLQTCRCTGQTGACAVRLPESLARFVQPESGAEGARGQCPAPIRVTGLPGRREEELPAAEGAVPSVSVKRAWCAVG